MESKLSANMEDYLETIYMLEMEKGNVRVKDISARMNLTMPSVSGAIKKLETHGMLRHPKYDLIVLTPSGVRTAEKIFRRHQVIRDFLCKVLGVSTVLAEKDACHMEHIISPETLAGFSRMLDLWKKEKSFRLELNGGAHES